MRQSKLKRVEFMERVAKEAGKYWKNPESEDADIKAPLTFHEMNVKRFPIYNKHEENVRKYQKAVRTGPKEKPKTEEGDQISFTFF